MGPRPLTACLFQLENYIQDNMKKEMVEMQQNAVQNQTAVMLEIGTNLLNQTAEQTRKLTDVEAQVGETRDAGRGPPGTSEAGARVRKAGWTDTWRTCGQRGVHTQRLHFPCWG